MRRVRVRHQRGSLQREKRQKSGETVWVFRWYEVQLDGTRRYRKAVIGTVSEFKTEAEAQTAADSLRLDVNEQTPRQKLQAISFETLVEHYRQHELPDVVHGTRPLGSEPGDDETRKSYSTQLTYQGYLRKWILPRWRSYRLTEVKPVQVEQWLKSLPMSKGSKAKTRNIMSALYSHAQRWEWTTYNPIRHVRQSAKRARIPTILTPQQLKELLENLVDRFPKLQFWYFPAHRPASGSESCLGLKWGGYPDFENLELRLTRDVVKQRIERCKTEASRKPVPIDAAVAEILWEWRLRCAYNQPKDWVFASPARRGNPTTLLAELHLSGRYPLQAGFREHPEDQGTGRLAHAAAQPGHADESKRRGREDDPGDAPSRQLQGDDGCVYAGHNGDQA